MTRTTTVTENTLVYKICQLTTTAWLRRELNLSADAPVYFDSVDLVYIDATVMRNALVNPKARLGCLRTALQKHIAQLN